LLGFYLSHYYDYVWDIVAFVQIPLCFVACTHALYIWQAGVIWQRFQAGEPAPAPKPKTIPYNHVGTPMTMEYNQTVTAPRLSKMQKFANILLHQIDMQKVDLRETYWIHPGRFDNRPQFIAARDALERVGGIERRDPKRRNSEFIVGDPRIIQMVANGVKIEDLPSPALSL
jgi:hypothetical protein